MAADESFKSRGSDLDSSHRSDSLSSFQRQSISSIDSVGSAILGQEIFEPREKFTLYKVEVRDGGKAWVVFRRYSDFVLLNKKLKKQFPNIQINLPPKRFFMDNFNRSFIKKRQAGLEGYMKNLFSLRDVIEANSVRKFFRLDNPPEPNEDLEACRSYCSSLESTTQRLRKDLSEQELELSYLRSELTLSQHSMRDTNPGNIDATNSLSYAVLQQRLIESQDMATRAIEELERLKEEIKAEAALSEATRQTERQRRELTVRDLTTQFLESQKAEDEGLRKLVEAFCGLGKVKIDIGGKSIDVKTVDGITEREIEIQEALVSTRASMERLHKEKVDMLVKDIEDFRVKSIGTDAQLQKCKCQIEMLRNTLNETHSRHHDEIVKREQLISELRTQLCDSQRYINSTEQKYFYSLLLGVKLNMALWGKYDQIASNQLKPAGLFAKVRNNGISIEHWPSWISRELATAVNDAYENN